MRHVHDLRGRSTAMLVNTFKGPVTSKYVAMDTETKVYIDGKILSDSEVRAMCGEYNTVGGERVYRYPPSWWREHARVECWAWIIYAPEGFAICESFEEFADLCIQLRIKSAWWYYAPFDFALIDSELLSRGWKQTERAKNPREYSELSSDFGARYTLTMHFPYARKRGDRSKRAGWRMQSYDLRNIFAGGLARLLEEFDARDGDGVPIRKLEMDYQGANGSVDDIKYMYADAAGLWWLVDRLSRYMEENYGYSIRNGKPDVLTASGLAKRVYFDERFGRIPYYKQKRCFRRAHPMTPEQDEYFRTHGLLGGGLVLVNPDIRGKHLTDIEAYRADVNSEYPFIMEGMRMICGRPDTFKTVEEARDWHGETACIIYEIDRLTAYVKPNKVPCWRNPFTGKILSEYIITTADTSLCIFKEEFDELSEWYDIESDRLHIRAVYSYKTMEEPALGRLMRREYERKTEAKIEGDAAKSYFSKLIMNGLGGKFSQNPRHQLHERVMTPDGHVHLEMVLIDEEGNRTKDPDEGTPAVELDEESIMHVVQGAAITCGGRVYLRKLAREICGENVRAKLLYTDTDSLHTLCTPPSHLVSSTRLGALKVENKTPIIEACFLAPKTYFETESGGITEVHAKGIRLEDIQHMHKKGVPFAQIYRPGFRIQSLSALNVRGGKMLLPLPKQIARQTDTNNIDEVFR